MFWSDYHSSSYFFERNELMRYSSLLLSTVGIFIFRSSFRAYSIRSFLGFQDETKQLKVDGILKYVRHPIYTATILMVISFFLFNPDESTLIMLLSTAIYLPIGIYLEETKLIGSFGDEYKNYRARVPALFPTIEVLKSAFKKSAQE